MIIRNGNVFQEDGSYRKMDLYVENGRIVSSEEEVSDKEEIDASGLKVLPGLVDIHSHGAVGHDFSDADATGLKKILKYEKAHGITSYCPTSMTLPMEQLIRIFASATEVEQDDSCARIVGLNMEGPFLDPAKKGAHVEEYIRKPDIRFFRECQEASGGMIKVVTVAPNMEGAEAFIEALKDDVVISIGHTGADYDCAAKAMIGDGIHIHPAVVRNTFRMFGEERIVLISDSMMAAGMENGVYELGGQKVIMNNRKAVLEDGTIAGSATNLYECMQCVIAMCVPEHTAIFAATRNPAKSIGIYGEVGSLVPGKRADMVLADEKLNIVRVI